MNGSINKVEWVQQFGGEFADGGFGIAADESGNSYVTGSFQLDASFGSTTVTTMGINDAFVAKLDSSGNVLWVENFNSTSLESISFSFGIDSDEVGNTYTTGFFTGTVEFGDTSLTSVGLSDVFVTKLDSNGNVIWAEQLEDTGLGLDFGLSISTDDLGNIYVTGIKDADPETDLSDISADPTSAEGEGFIAKLDSSGNLVWTENFDSTSFSLGRDVATDEVGNSYVLGNFSGDVNLGNQTLSSSGDTDIFVTKLDSNGNVEWNQKLGGTLSDNATGITLDKAGNTYITGEFEGTSTFGNITLTSNGDTDAFVAKLDNSGNIVWAQSFGGTSLDSGTNITLDEQDNIYLTGSFEDTVSFGDTTFTSSSENDGFNVNNGFIVKLDTDGNILSAEQLDYSLLDIAAGNAGNIYGTGGFEDTVNIGDITLTSEGFTDGLVVNLDFNETSFTPFDPADDPVNLINAIVTDDNLTIHLDGDFSPTFTGGEGQTSFYDGSLTPLGIGSGILLTSGDGTPPLTNTSGSYGVSLGGVGDADLDGVATAAFPGAGATEDANLLEFSFDITDPNVKSVTFDIVFGSDEFPEFSNSDFVDVAGVFVNGQNYAYFNNDVTQPLSIIDNNLQLGNFTDNTTGILPIEYDGVSDVLKILAPVQEGKNTIKFGVADTGDQIFDSGLFVANLQTSTLGDGNNSGLFVNITGTEGDDELIGSEINEFIDAGAGNDTINPGSGDDIVDAGAGDDTIFGGEGDNEIDGGDGVDTVVYAGNQNEFNIEKIGDVIKVGNNTDTLTNVEFLSFDDATISTSDIKEEEQNLIIATDVNGTTVEAIDLTGFTTDKVTVDYTISREADYENQVYFYAVDDITGTVGGVAVGEDGYMEAALNSLVSPVFSTSDDNTETGSLEFDAGSIVVPVIIADGTLNEALSGEAEVYFPYLGANTDDGNFDHIKLLDDKTFGFEDLPNGGDQDFNDIIIEINSIA